MQHKKSEKKLRIGISMGDINGIGPELIIKTLSDDRLLNRFTPIVYGSTKVLSYYKKVLSFDGFQYAQLKDWNAVNPKKTQVVNCLDDNPVIEMGKTTFEAGKYSVQALDKALEDYRNGKFDVLVTCPLNKNSAAQYSEGFSGHTEYITNYAGNHDSLMVMTSETIRVGLVTNHIPHSKVHEMISQELISKKIKLMHQSLQEDFVIQKPKIAVLGLNPHAGDDGILGKEEQEMIIPAVNQSFRDGMYVFGPYPADGFFASNQHKQFDAVLAMYHDQGLIPFKTLAYPSGINFTAGLPIVRTSPDHGTAFDIVGKGLADVSSFRNALFTALDIYQNRMQFIEHKKNPIQKVVLEEE